jgi:hypothetical protein
VLVRSLWLAFVELLDWNPQHETERRITVLPDAAREQVTLHKAEAIHRRLFHEAMAAADRNRQSPTE